ncbi:MAG: 3'-5' exonuclease [Chloroflexi bacterium]|nr:3'-5' exonuclease [Chloroflexota bacterium]
MYDGDLAATTRALAQDLHLVRPLAVLDLETTGVNAATDRAVEIAALRIEPSGAYAGHSRRVHPGMPIPAAATAVHGITDGDVALEPSFGDIARRLADFLEGCDLAGFNVGHFDIPLLEAEFRRAGVEFSMEGRRIVDAQGIFHHYEPRDLAAAVRFYTDRDIEDAHSARGDLVSTLYVLRGQLERYGDLPRDVAALDQLAQRRRYLVLRDGEPWLAFGRHNGRPLREAVADDPSYFNWILAEGTFPTELTDAVRRIRAAVTPTATR